MRVASHPKPEMANSIINFVRHMQILMHRFTRGTRARIAPCHKVATNSAMRALAPTPE
jgi:hypothetical protein